MILLKRLFSETKAFDEIIFKNGLNIIKGEYKTEKGKRGELNGIGKTLIINLIDLMFLSGSAQKLFKKNKFDFLKGHSATLELVSDENSFFIKKEFSELNKIKISDKLSNLTEYTVKEAKNVLFDKIFGHLGYKGDINSKYFRDLIRFFIKDDRRMSAIDNPINFIHSTKNKFAFGREPL